MFSLKTCSTVACSRVHTIRDENDERALVRQVYCSRTCKDHEAALRSAEAGAVGKLDGISAARDVDLDLLRMMLRLVITRAKALRLRPMVSCSGGCGGSRSEAKTGEGGGGAADEVSKRLRYSTVFWTITGPRGSCSTDVDVQ